MISTKNQKQKTGTEEQFLFYLDDGKQALVQKLEMRELSISDKAVSTGQEFLEPAGPSGLAYISIVTTCTGYQKISGSYTAPRFSAIMQ